MGKVKRQARKHSNHHDAPNPNKSKVSRRQHSQQFKAQPRKHVAQKADNNAQQARFKVPFTKHDIVLLVGEGKSTNQLISCMHEWIVPLRSWGSS